MVHVLFVCLGNICRSPVAEGVFRRLVAERRLGDRIRVDSAGTGGWHVGHPPDQRMRATAESHGVSLSGIEARKVYPKDLEAFDYVFAMDRENFRDLKALSSPAARDKIRLFRDFDPAGGEPDVPDPYYGGRRGFDEVFDIVDRTSRSILDFICTREGIARGEGDEDTIPLDSASA